ncbi:MAG: SAM-dependent methyltransferase [Piscirickettsiaceae bacterium]|nr:MAG: SAM-dependent methyltransferase [Piscirickettsiaceae bacterium]
MQPIPIVLNGTDVPCSEIMGLIKLKAFYLLDLERVHAHDLYLSYSSNALTLNCTVGAQSLSLSIDFVLGKSQHRRLYGGGKNQPLAKACGLNKHPEWNILDATAGLGRDAFVLASLGSNITLCEQNAVLYSLLVDALSRASNDIEATDIIDRMTCVHHNTIDYLNLSIKSPADVIYLDPMYPDRKKSAKIKKDMQILQHLVGHSGEEGALLDIALQTASHRVVVKRPKSAEPLSSIKPSYIVSSPNTRYDVYVR